MRNKIYSHPFNIALLHGTLNRSTFNHFLEQDRLYLFDFGRALAITAKRLPQRNQQLLFHKLSDDSFQTVAELHHKYLIIPNKPGFFQASHRFQKKNLSIQSYTNYLLEMARYAPVELSVASLIPCYFIYTRLGLHMRNALTNNHPYRLWITSYSTQHFLFATECIIQTANELGQNLSSVQEQLMIEAFINSVMGEIAIWDSVWMSQQQSSLENF